ncbi:MAG: Lycopene cyclase, partial [uncultured Acidimicrobiales bacterium]
ALHGPGAGQRRRRRRPRARVAAHRAVPPGVVLDRLRHLPVLPGARGRVAHEALLADRPLRRGGDDRVALPLRHPGRGLRVRLHPDRPHPPAVGALPPAGGAAGAPAGRAVGTLARTM